MTSTIGTFGVAFGISATASSAMREGLYRRENNQLQSLGMLTGVAGLGLASFANSPRAIAATSGVVSGIATVWLAAALVD